MVKRDDFDLKEVLTMYADDLPDSTRMEEEFIRWKREWVLASKNKEPVPDSVAKSLKACDYDAFPNVYTLLQIFGTIAVTSCECERSGSVLRRLNTYLARTWVKSE